MIWIAGILSAIWCLIMLWPRADGGGIAFSLAMVVPPWISLGPMAAIWIVWGILHFAFGVS